jgi:nitrogen fixation protein NifQ
MLRHFTALARRNNQDMKWKKFLYRTICREDGFSMCVAPCCSECGDFDACFGSESGESLLTPLRIPDESSRLVSVASSFAQ